MSYKCKYFEIQELVAPSIYSDRGDKAWELLDTRALVVLDILKVCLSPNDPVIVNDYSWGGKFSQSGLRDKNHYGTLRKYHDTYSQHKYGRAFDVKFRNKTIEEVQDWIDENWQDVCDQLDCKISLSIEVLDGMTWLHFDVRNRPFNDDLIWKFKP